MKFYILILTLEFIKLLDSFFALLLLFTFELLLLYKLIDFNWEWKYSKGSFVFEDDDAIDDDVAAAIIALK